MKKVFIILLTFLTGGAFAQTNISISSNETVSLIFPFPIRHVDRGTKDILVQQPKESDNILLVKASAPQMATTNLSVIVGDGSVYAFTVAYAEHPKQWIYQVPVNKQATIATYANSILDNSRTMRGPKDVKWEIGVNIKGIYIKGDVIYYQLQLHNYSPLDYDVELLKFFIKDKRKGKRTASQENEMVPLYIAGNTKQIKSYNSSVIVVALDKFTIPDAKSLVIQLMEENGGRHLQIKVKNKHILRAIPLPDLN